VKNREKKKRGCRKPKLWGGDRLEEGEEEEEEGEEEESEKKEDHQM
jgi:hypothetical protein